MAQSDFEEALEKIFPFSSNIPKDEREYAEYLVSIFKRFYVAVTDPMQADIDSLKHQLANMTALADEASKRCGELSAELDKAYEDLGRM